MTQSQTAGPGHRPLGDVVTSAQRREAYRAQGLWTEDTLAARVNLHARTSPTAVAVVDERGARCHTYLELQRDSAAVAQRLRETGVLPGDVVCLQLPNRYEAVVCAVAINSLGAVINPLLPNYRAKELLHVFRTAQPRAIITPQSYRGCDYPAMVAEVRAQSGVEPIHVVDGPVDPMGAAVSLVEILGRAAADPMLLSETPSAVSELIFTSGTEATPKAIMHTEANTNLAARTVFVDLGASGADVVWMPSPVGHSTGFNYGIRVAIYHGCTLVLQDLWDAAEAVRLVQQFNCSYTLAATTFLRDLVEECERTGARLDQLAHFGCGGAPVAPELVARAQQVGIGVLRLYGSTEVLCATWNRPGDPLAVRMHTDGRPLSHTEIEIRGEAGDAVSVGTPGELYVRSAQASVGFYGDEARTAATYLPDGWIRTGDLGVLDAQGHLAIVGRKKEIIIRGGVNIAPREIEDMLATFPEIERAVVVGMPDERLGERGCACVVLRPGQRLELTELVGRLTGAGLATYKLPERLEIVERLPMTASGKVQKHELVRRIQDLDRSSQQAVLPMHDDDARLVTCVRQEIPGRAGLVGVITLNRPDQLNAISWDLVAAFDAAITELASDESVRAIVVTGRGRAFSAGGDLKAYQQLQRDSTRFPQFIDDLHAAFSRLRGLRVPVIALINGVTAAGGLELLLSCDIALAAQTARIGDAHLNFGQMGGGGVLTLLPRIIGIAKAVELVMTGRFLSSAEAAEWGLVSRVVPDEELFDAGMELVQSIAAKSPLAVANAKQVMNAVWSDAMSVSTGLRLERDRDALYCLTSEDAPEGLAAFAEKREPVFTGR
ncbi:MAG: acyl-CoA synthetase [Pseudonocardiales bacterium]|jgi:acyl-CoA synthetase (AMP-forming)/AMP-acid ligase II/enoyl-CoA hydratase/carnithine racemase|nr:acyl-CoA synthetase [Pseudonocardiales bacterium]